MDVRASGVESLLTLARMGHHLHIDAKVRASLVVPLGLVLYVLPRKPDERKSPR